MSKAVSSFVAGMLIGVLCATAGFALFLRAGGGDSRQTVLKLGHSHSPGHPAYVAMEFMKQRLEELSGRPHDGRHLPQRRVGI